MKILLTGASGFIGSRLLTRLSRAGCEVVCVSRRRPARLPAHASWTGLDFNQATQAQDWQDALKGVDVVVNAVGILRESSTQTFDIVHRLAPCALFEAAALAGVRHIVQISALGADERAQSRYHLSKKAADDYLLALGVRASIIQPSLVYGPGGASATLFETFAGMPLIPLPGDGGQCVQPVHVDDLTAALRTVVLSASGPTRKIPMVGPRPLTLKQFYLDLRAAMAIPRPARFLPIPMPLMRAIARTATPVGLLDRETLDMLERGNTGDVGRITELLGRPPREPRCFIPANRAGDVGIRARLTWLLPMLRLAIALVWLVTGVLSLGIYPVGQSLQLLDRSGVPAALGPLFLYGAAGLDLALGALTLWPRRSRWLWAGQAGLIILYTAIITLKLPEFWLHPYGPVLKNVPMLAVLWLLYEMEDR